MQTAVLKPENPLEVQKSPVPAVVSFAPYLKYLEAQMQLSEGAKASFYRFIIRKFRQNKVLSQPISDLAILAHHTELLELVEATIFPLTHPDGNDLFALALPLTFEMFYYSDAMHNLMADKKTGFIKPLHESFPKETFRKKKDAFLYSYILEKFYNIHHPVDHTLGFPIWDDESEQTRYFNVKVDRRFAEVICNGPLPEVDPALLKELENRAFDTELLKNLIPLDNFSLEGFAVLTVKDVTVQESIEQIKNTILGIQELDESEVFAYISNSLKTLLGENELEVGLLPFLSVNNRFVLDEEISSRSILIKSGCDCMADDNSYRQMAEKYEKDPAPFLLSTITEEVVKEMPMAGSLFNSGIRGYLLMPLYTRSKIVGVLEIAAKKPGLLTAAFIAKLEPAQALLGQVLQHSIEVFDNKIEQTIREKFTSLQPSVEWKFADVAWDYIRSRAAENHTSIGNVVFDDVYPIYGAVDIRNSSVERNAAIQKDHLRHLEILHIALNGLSKHVAISLLEEMIFKCSKWHNSISEVLNAEDEIKINDFFDNDVKPLLSHFRGYQGEVATIVEEYFRQADPQNGTVHHYRSDYEQSVELINTTLIKYLDKERKTLQKSYPNYFEKYKTDGIEYNIYIGQSIAPAKPFDELYLKNLHLWQLSSMAEIVRITHALLPQMKIPLHTTQLILIHSNAISISFRRDERRFDVEGAYNIRYEIMKKRIDKVHIKETGERLTQPGKIALVYSNRKEAQEYIKYIEYLQEKQLLDRNLEYLDLEEVQGLLGLRALRVGVLQPV
jgi:hypothetical protein